VRMCLRARVCVRTRDCQPQSRTAPVLRALRALRAVYRVRAAPARAHSCLSLGSSTSTRCHGQLLRGLCLMLVDELLRFLHPFLEQAQVGESNVVGIHGMHVSARVELAPELDHGECIAVPLATLVRIHARHVLLSSVHAVCWPGVHSLNAGVLLARCALLKSAKPRTLFACWQGFRAIDWWVRLGRWCRPADTAGRL
jgi:hypothetical protein